MEQLPSNLTPKKQRSFKDNLVIVFGVICGFYLLNPTMGFFEFLPDRLPIIGNLDEAAATAGLLFTLRYFGLDLGKWIGKK